MQISRPDALGIPRVTAWVPTDDTSSGRPPGLDAAFEVGSKWTPAGLSALGHRLMVNIPSGSLVVAATDLEMPYYYLRFEAARTFDAQEQHAQQRFLDSHPNTDPRPHLFANWQSSREVTVAEVWLNAFPEFLVSEGGGDSALFYRSYPEFAVNTPQQADVEQRLRAYGVPGRTLEALGWSYARFDCVLRARQGSFSVLVGSYRGETLIDPADIRLYRFDPVSGAACRYSSEFAYQQLIAGDGSREATVQSLAVDTVDELGHHVVFRPVETEPPYRTYKLQDGSGRALRFELDDYIEYLDGNHRGGVVKTYVVSRVTDETQTTANVTEYSYDGGRLVEVRQPGHAGGTQRIYRYDYDAFGHLVGITDPVGDSLRIEYVEDFADADERLMPRLKVARIVDGEGNEARYAYDHAARAVNVTFTGAAGDTRTIAYSYIEDANDTRQRYITSERIAVAQGYSGNQVVENRWSYSADGRFSITAVRDGLGGETSFERNDFNQITRQVDATGHARDFQYDVRTAPTPADPHRYDLIGVSETNVDADGNAFDVAVQATFDRYDATSSADPQDSAQSTHRIETRTNELGDVSRFDYDDAGSHFPTSPTRYTDALGNAVTRGYDEHGLPVRETDAESNTREMLYNARGQMVSRRDPNGFERRWVYDSASGWLTDTTDALGAVPGDPAHSIHYEWTAAGQRSRETDPVGATVEYIYSANKRLRTLVRRDPAPRSLSFAFNACGALTEIRDPAGRTTHFDIDEAGRVYATWRDSAPQARIQTRFDVAGRPIAITDRNGQTTVFGYDAVGRVVSIREPDWPAGAPVNPGKHVTIDYDKRGRRLRVSDSELPRPSRYDYDAAGNLTAASETFGSTLHSVYDATGALIRLKDDSGVIDLRFGRDHAGRLSSVTDSDWRDPARTFTFIRTDGALVDNLYRIEGPSGFVRRFSYDGNHRITAANADIAGTPLSAFGYQYRNDGLLGRRTGDDSGEYDYDGMKRLASETDAGVASGYDAAGNRLWRSGSQPPSAQFNSYDDDNRLTSAPADQTTYQYDQNGNTLVRQPAADQPTRYTYDGANRLRRVERGGSRIDYLFDCNGRLLERARTTGTATDRARFVYANRAVLADLDAGDQPVTVYTRTDGDRLLRRRSASALVPAPGTDPHSLLYVHDGLGSVARLVDMDGSARLSVSYDAWGKATSSGQAVDDRFRYRGAFQDGDTGLLLFGRRWYDPALGRWLSQDPILADVLAARRDAADAALDIANVYVYVGNNPLNLVDPSGLSIFDWMKWFRSTTPGEVLEKAMKGRALDPKTLEPQDSRPEQVEKKSIDPNEDEAADTPDEFEPGAGEGSRSPSSQRTYNNPARSARGGGGGAEYVLAGGAAALVVVAAAPVEVTAAIGGGIVAAFVWVFD